MNQVFNILELLNDFIWAHIAFLLLAVLGLYFTIRSRFFQVRKFPAILRSFAHFFYDKTSGNGVHPLKAFFAAIGGCIGIGNIVGICTAVEIGGPGALFWTWVGGLFGMVIQYAEVYLGMKYRVKNSEGSFDGGPMYFLPPAYKGKWIAPVMAILLCIYGVEFFMFNVMADSISTNWHLNQTLVITVLLLATVLVATGGIRRVGEVCSAVIPLFILLYLGMGLWVLGTNILAVPEVIRMIFEGAFSSQAAVGGFAGSTVALTISMGLSRGAYSGDIGVGYTSIIHAESRTTHFGRQASLAIVGIFLDTFVICSISIFLVLLTGHWKEGIDSTLMVQEALGLTFPYMHFFMPFFLFLLGYTTILAYFVVGVKCAKFIAPKWGPILYYTYACITLPL
ncbi:MAG TPA: amino acid carrier protein, partial [Chlamydiales bacterium]|nr:amino acid carrier protein [Chlamydiales bacterium]